MRINFVIVSNIGLYHWSLPFYVFGISLNQNINWKAYLYKVSIKLYHVIGLLHKTHFFTQHILITTYKSLINSHFILWSAHGMSKTSVLKKYNESYLCIGKLSPYFTYQTFIEGVENVYIYIYVLFSCTKGIQ